MDFKWYTLATYSGSEMKVSGDINKMAELMKKVIMYHND